MTDLKRLNYYTGQFLLEKDFKDEQAYHMEKRRRLNMLFQPATVTNLDVDWRSESLEVNIGEFFVLDAQYREIVSLERLVITLTPPGPGDWYLMVAHLEERTDRDPQGIDNYTRWNETFRLIQGATIPGDGLTIPLAKFRIDSLFGTDLTIMSVDTRLNPRYGIRAVAENAIDEPQLQPQSVTASKLRRGSVGMDALGVETLCDDFVENLAPRSSHNFPCSVVDASVHQFLFVSVIPSRPDAKISYTQTVERVLGSQNNLYIVSVTNNGPATANVAVIVKALVIA
jgi:hypothetical protein